MNEAALGPEAGAISGDTVGGSAVAPEITVGAAPEVKSGATPEDPKTGASTRFGAETARGSHKAQAEPIATGTALIRLPLEKPRRRFSVYQTSHGLVAGRRGGSDGVGFRRRNGVRRRPAIGSRGRRDAPACGHANGRSLPRAG